MKRSVAAREADTDSLANRVVDLVASGAGLILLAPLLIVIGLAVKVADGGPSLYRARRVGKGGRNFSLFKFRTMVTDADKHGAGITASGDARITRIGGWLRRTKLDELPQLYNVLRGDMTLVGPRPEDPRYVALYTPEQRRILELRPGITSVASLTFRHEEELLQGPDWESVYRERVLPEKLAIDLEYARRRTLGSDLHVIGRTVLSVLNRQPRPINRDE